MIALIVCWVVFPLVVTAVAIGCGLLLEHLSGTRLSSGLLAPAGFAVVLVAGHIATASNTTAELAVPVVLALAVAGLAVAFPFVDRRIDWWALATGCAVYLAFAAPVLLSGDASFTGYIKLDDTATWLAMTDRLMDHGRDLSGLPPSSYEATLALNLAGGYPVGAFPPLGIGAMLVGQDPAWVFQPYEALLAAYTGVALYAITERAIEARPMRTLIAVIAAQSALLFGYSLWGGVKELAAAWGVALLAALLVPLLRGRMTPLSVLPLAVASAALLAVLSFGGAVWLVPVLVPALIALWRVHGRRAALAGAAAFVGLAALLSVPTLLQADVFLRPASGTLTSNTELGNLIEPLSRLQLFGIWPAGDFRLDPEDLSVTYVLIAVMGLAAILGVIWALHRRSWEVLLYLVAGAGGALAISAFGSPWVGAKALATAAPAIVLVAGVGAAALVSGGRLVEGVLLAAVLAGGVVWSNALAYHEATLAPHDRHDELRQIGEDIAGEGPTLMTEYEPYGVRHFLRKGDPEGVSELRRRPIPLRNGRVLDKLEVADVDQLALDGLLVYRTLVLRRSPVTSRPPSIYTRVRSGRFYDVWQRQPGSEQAVLQHLSLGDATSASATVPCKRLRRLVRTAEEQGARVAVARRPKPATAQLFAAPGSRWTPVAGASGAVYPTGDARIDTHVVVAGTAQYEIFVAGSFRGRLRIAVDGREVASHRHQLSHSGVYEPLGTARLRAGRHQLGIEYDVSAVSPGSGGFESPLGPVMLARVSQQRVELLSPTRAATLCGERLDWVEAVSL